MKEELMSLSIKGLALGAIVGLIVGIAVGYAVTPQVDVTPFEQRISELEEQVADLENEIDNKTMQISELDSQISELQSQIEDKDNQMMVLQAQISEKNIQMAALQNQISQLQSQVEELEQLVPPYTMGEWNPVASFQGNSGLTTEFFYVAGTELRLNWSWTSSVEENAEFSIYLYQQGETIITEACISLQKEGVTYVHDLEAAYYYLKIYEANLDQWDVSIEVLILE